MKRIIVFGFPHCGTSILKSVLGHLPTIYEVKAECKMVTDAHIEEARIMGAEGVVIKYPYLIDPSEYANYYMLFILRNPYYVFTSLVSRFKGNLPSGHTVADYIVTLNQYKYTINNKPDQMIHLRYETLFNENYRAFRELISEMQIEMDESIFNNNQYKNGIVDSMSGYSGSEREHLVKRTKQINQPLENMNLKRSVDLPLNFLFEIAMSKEIRSFGYHFKMQYIL